MCVCVGFVVCVFVYMCGFCSVCVFVYMCGFCNVWARARARVCVCMCVYRFCNVWVYCNMYTTTLTGVFPCFFLSYKSNARVKLTKTGHGSHSSKLVFVLFFVICVVLCIVCV